MALLLYYAFRAVTDKFTSVAKPVPTHATRSEPNAWVESLYYEFADRGSHWVEWCNNKRFVIQTSLAQFHKSPKVAETYTQMLDYQDALDAGASRSMTRCDFEAQLLKAFESLFRQLAPEPMRLLLRTVQDAVYPVSYECTLMAYNDFLVPKLRQDQTATACTPGIVADENLIDWVPSFSAHEVEAPCEGSVRSNWPPTMVVAAGTQYHFQALRRSDSDAVAWLERYRKLADLDLGPEAHIRRLHGVVRGEGGCVVGLLLTYIPDAGPPERGAARAGVWIKQLRHTVGQLHAEGLIWGDPKMNNAVVDGEGNLWIGSFGSSYPNGLDAALIGTREGDLQGLQRLADHLIPREYSDLESEMDEGLGQEVRLDERV